MRFFRSLTIVCILICSTSAAYAGGFEAGDANKDCRFDSEDFIQMFQAGTYERNTPATWSSGDFTGDELFDSSDFIAAFQTGNYETGQYCEICEAKLIDATEGCQVLGADSSEQIVQCLTRAETLLHTCPTLNVIGNFCSAEVSDLTVRACGTGGSIGTECGRAIALTFQCVSIALGE